MKLDLQQIARMTGGRLSPATARGTVTGVSTDSRTIHPGDLFVPLRGPNFDGHEFLMQAVRRGAAACLSEDVLAGYPVPVIGVHNTLTALGDLAASYRRAFPGPVVAVTGSSGKTTTKDMLHAILALHGPGLATEGNFNNLVGLPLTLFKMMPSHRWAVLEMGMSARGEIARLAEIAAPGVGIVTNIGPAHLEGLQTLEGVARAKGELFAALPSGGTAVINADDDRVRELPVANGVQRLWFGLNPAATVRAETIRSDGEGVNFELILPNGRYPVKLAVPGRHNVANALAAAAAALVLEIPAELIVRGLQTFRARAGRMETVRLADGSLLLDDSYNANPLAVKAALEALAESGTGRKIAVLGDMLELGEAAADLHREVGAAVASRADYLIVLGAQAEATAAGARTAGMAADRVRVVADHEAAIAMVRTWLRPGDSILVKGSRGMRMDQVSGVLRVIESCRKAGNC
jgi:UDP-N-acetylmuramoyl-tripeptide--D-alanyl-D-alanine ligase